LEDRTARVAAAWDAARMTEKLADAYVSAYSAYALDTWANVVLGKPLGDALAKFLDLAASSFIPGAEPNLPTPEAAELNSATRAMCGALFPLAARVGRSLDRIVGAVVHGMERSERRALEAFFASRPGAAIATGVREKALQEAQLFTAFARSLSD
jgi:hypothetical protein